MLRMRRFAPVASDCCRRSSKRPIKWPTSQKSKGRLRMAKWVYAFEAGCAEGDSSMRELLGGKGANLAEMSNLGLPVPPGFTITTEVCTWYYNNHRCYPPELKSAVDAAMQRLSALIGARFGDPG